MNYDDLKKNCCPTGQKIIGYGNSIRISYLVFGILILVGGVFGGLLSENFAIVISGLFAGLICIAIGEFLCHLLSGLGEIVINTEITARSSCDSITNIGNNPSKKDLPEL